MCVQRKYDIFLSHNSEDKQQVQAIAKYLEARGLELWFDQDQIDAGDVLPDEIQEAITNSKSAAIFIGNRGLGKWQKLELDILLWQKIYRTLKIIPILLPDVNELPNEPTYLFLKQEKYINLSNKNTKALNSLAQSVTKWLPEWVEKELERLSLQKEEIENKAQEEVQKVEREIQQVQKEKDKGEGQSNQKELKQINKETEQIKQQIEFQLGSEETPQRREAFEWLSSVKTRVEKYANKALKSFSELEVLVKDKPGGFEDFCTDLETCLEFVYFAFKIRSFSFLDAISIDFSLADINLYQENACIEVYQAALDLIIRMIPNERLDKATRQELKRYLGYLKKQLKILA